MSQRELAELVGHIDAAGVSKIETGVTKLGRVRATRFARALGVEVSQLLPPTEPQPTLQDVIDLLAEAQVHRERGFAAQADALVGIGAQLARIEALLRLQGGREQTS